ncbi:ribonuclease HII [Tribonema minus]|uniref:Ribonuclease n=1 Tax=Tribonema minus TaxID=303371 RepID=A0A835ZCH7_9STRA|nr:ribonuclease HII [Tribonema minus]
MSIVGVDEVGRGCLYGCVTAAAMVLPETFPDEGYKDIKDSKKLSAKKRAKMDLYIKEHAIAYAVGSASAAEIDALNIQNATFLAMHRALEQIEQQTSIAKIMVDGNRFLKYKHYEHECIVGGDAVYKSISAASILAKVYRDTLMEERVKADPRLNVYELAKNKGYGTKTHMDAIAQHGITEDHRKSFKPCCDY